SYVEAFLRRVEKEAALHQLRAPAGHAARPDAALRGVQRLHRVVWPLGIAVQDAAADLLQRLAIDEHLLAVDAPRALDEHAAAQGLPAGDRIRALDQGSGAGAFAADQRARDAPVARRQL